MNKVRQFDIAYRQLYYSAKIFRPMTVSTRFINTKGDKGTEESQTPDPKVDDSKQQSISSVNTKSEDKEQKLSGFAQSFEKFSILDKQKDTKRQSYSFAKLLRNSTFVDLGDPEGKVVSGQIFQTVGDDLYIDFGWKFYCVCQRPVKNGQYYVRGSIVRLRVKDLELSTRFLGASMDISLLEADCTLIGLISSPLKRTYDAKAVK